LPYSFGVRACTASNVCDENIAKRSLTLPDAGAPLTTGATSAVIQNGEAVIQAPWTSVKGAIKKRRVYKRTGSIGGSNLADYSLERTYTVADLTNPDTILRISPLSENTTYH